MQNSQNMHKFGIECPKMVEDALELNKHSGNTIWVDAIAEEMKNVQMAFEPLEADSAPKWVPDCLLSYDL